MEAPKGSVFTMQRWFQRGKFVALVLVALALTMAGCGISSAVADAGHATKPLATTPPVRATVIGIATCPATTQGVTWPTPATALLSLAQPTATILVGQSIEVVLPLDSQWRFSPAGAQNVLQLQQPAGYLDTERQRCVWRFVAVTRGQSILTYTRIAKCVPGTKCSQVAEALPLTVTVS
jgi:hypothetical protein